MLTEKLTEEMVEVEHYKKQRGRVNGLSYDDEPELGESRQSRKVNKTEGLEMDDYIPPPPRFADDPPLPSEFEHIGNVQQNERVEKPTNNPIMVLLNKMKKTPKSIKMELKLNIPSKDMYNMLSENFDGAEEAIIDYLTTGKNLKEFKDQFKLAIIEYYKKSPKNKKIDEEDGN